MNASTNNNVRNLWLGLLALALALTVWATTLIARVQSSSDLAQQQIAVRQMGGPGGGSGTGG